MNAVLASLFACFCNAFRSRAADTIAIVHQAFEMDTPSGRPIQHQDHGDVVEIPELGGLHHHYERQAA